MLVSLTSVFSHHTAGPAFDYLEKALGKYSSEGPFFLGKFGLVSFKSCHALLNQQLNASRLLMFSPFEDFIEVSQGFVKWPSICAN